MLARLTFVFAAVCFFSLTLGFFLFPSTSSGRKVLKQGLKGEKLNDWYVAPLKEDGVYVNFDRIYHEQKLQRMKRRGKGPPKKGQGKRASKGK
mmetsp:Transcript_3924/g.7419  ORF Transcript_3924/g.7419 Transcript_3924/m.7419 type:complete len:93 (+) Transcript_3924:311-589(+)